MILPGQGFDLSKRFHVRLTFIVRCEGRRGNFHLDDEAMRIAIARANRTSVKAYYTLANGKPYARATGFASSRFIDPIERFKKMIERGFGDPQTFIPDLNANNL